MIEGERVDIRQLTGENKPLCERNELLEEEADAVQKEEGPVIDWGKNNHPLSKIYVATTNNEPTSNNPNRTAATDDDQTKTQNRHEHSNANMVVPPRVAIPKN